MPRRGDLAGIKAALNDLGEAQLKGLADAARNAPGTAPGLLALIEAACEWELNRRVGKEYALQLPDNTILDEEAAVSIDTARVLRLAFARDSRPLRAFFDELVKLLSGENRRRH